MGRFFAWLRRRRARAIQVVCCDMWAVYIDAVHLHLPQATLVFDRVPISRPLNRAVDEVRRQTWRQMAGREKAEFNKTRFLWLSNPENLRREARTRLSALLRLNSPIVKGVPPQGGPPPVLGLPQHGLGRGPPAPVALAGGP